MTPLACECLDALLVVLLHHGGRVNVDRLAAIMALTGVPRSAAVAALVEGHHRGYFGELGTNMILLRAGWTVLADEAEPLPC